MKEKKPLNVEIGQNVKALREQAGLTQERFAELVGLGEKHISAIECGAVGLSLPTLCKICRLLSVPADRVLFGAKPVSEHASPRADAAALLAQRLDCLTDRQFWAAKEVMDKVLEAMSLPPEE